MDRNNHRYLFWNSVFAILATILLVVVFYYWVDQQIAEWVYHYEINDYRIFCWLTYLASSIWCIAPALIIYVAIKFCFASLRYIDRVLFVISVNVLVTSYFKDCLKDAFGRCWPLSWKANMQALIPMHYYGFHPFHAGALNDSFPSGHTTVTFAAFSIIWLVYPKYRWLCILICSLVMIGLLGADFHFASDILAGAVLGSITGAFAAVMFLGPDKKRNAGSE